MLEQYNIHTDLALEDKERFETDNVEISGVSVDEIYDNERDIRITTVKILTENGAKSMRKPVGTYITIEAPNMTDSDEKYQIDIAGELAKQLKEILQLKKEDYTVLVVGLGNRNVTPDALGPQVVDELHITRHVIKEYGKYAIDEEESHMVSAITPGVMAQTGMETSEIVKGIVDTIKPDVVLYEEGLDDQVISESIHHISNADMLIIGGTSLVVYPAAGMIRYFRGSQLVLLNKSNTSADEHATLCIRDSIGQVLKQIEVK